MLSSVQKALRNLLVGDGEAVPARGCSRADGVAESPPVPLLRCRLLQAGGPVPLRALSRPIPELGGRDRIGPSLTQFGDPSRAVLRLESLTPGSLLPSLRLGKL